MLADRLSKQLWTDIKSLIDEMSGNDEVTRGVVIKTDQTNQCVFVKEFGETAIPVVGFTHLVAYYDTTATDVQRKTVTTEIVLPKVGDLVIILKQAGARRLPLCIGIVKGKNYIGVQ